MGVEGLTLSLPAVTKTEFLLTISIQSQVDKWRVNRKISVSGLSYDSIPNSPTKIISNVQETVRGITKRIMGVNGLIRSAVTGCFTNLYILTYSLWPFYSEDLKINSCHSYTLTFFLVFYNLYLILFVCTACHSFSDVKAMWFMRPHKINGWVLENSPYFYGWSTLHDNSPIYLLYICYNYGSENEVLNYKI